MEIDDNYVPESNFDDLDDECMWYIFAHLTFKQRVGVMRVCRQWKDVIVDMIKIENCLELEMVTNDSLERLDYTSDENERQNLVIMFGKQAELFFNHELYSIEKVCIRSADNASKPLLTPVGMAI